MIAVRRLSQPSVYSWVGFEVLDLLNVMERSGLVTNDVDFSVCAATHLSLFSLDNAYMNV